jgi:phospholipase/carboxylesterase
MNARGFNFELLPGRSSRTLLLLHGTGGDEHDLLPLGRALDPAATLLSPRGQVSENGAPRFFRRLAEGVFDEADVIARAEELAQFVREVANTHRLDHIMPVGYSNGANIALAMTLLGLMRFDRAILFRPMVPLSRLPSEVDLDSQRVFISAGEFDPIANAVQVNALAKLLRERGAEVEVAVLRSGHELTSADLEMARDWLAGAAIA